MESLTRTDLKLVNDLVSRKYKNNSIRSNATSSERARLLALKRKLKVFATYFKEKYDNSYGVFEASASSGNPIGRGTTLNSVWSAISKGAKNKQYSAQVGFVINKEEPALNVGFYFGRASARGLSKKQREEFEARLTFLGKSLSEAIQTDPLLNQKYQLLFDYGFKAYSGNNIVSPDQWLSSIISEPKTSQVIVKILPNDFGIIENSVIDYFVSQVVFLMAAIPEGGIIQAKRKFKPMTPEQRAKQAERRAQIGLAGELYIMKEEKTRLKLLNLTGTKYPKHVALESENEGYDILSVNENNEEIQIEVKTTTRPLTDSYSRRFFISSNEYNFYLNNKKSFKLYRVYDVENSPSYDLIDLNGIEPEADGYVIRY